MNIKRVMKAWALFIFVGFSYLGLMLREQSNPVNSVAATACFVLLIAVYFHLQETIKGGDQ